MKKIVVVLLVASIYHLGWTQGRSFTGLTESAKPITVPYGQKCFSVALRANPTTGFTWTILSYDHQRLSLVSKHYRQLEPHLMGSPGIQYFNFALASSVTKPQCGVIRLTYTRPWEHQAGPVTNIKWCYAARNY